MNKPLLIAGLVLLCSLPSQAQTYLATPQTNLAASAQSVVVTISSTGGSNTLLWAVCGEAHDTTSVITMSDSASNTWSQLGSYAQTGSVKSGMFFVNNATAVTSVTCSWNTGINTRVAMTVGEIVGSATSSPTDGSIQSTVSNGTSLGSSNITTTTANDILIYGVFNITGGSDALTNSFTFPTNGIGSRIDVGCRAVAATGTYSTTLSWGTSGTATGTFGAFKATGTQTTSCTPPNSAIPAINKKSKLDKIDDAHWIQPLWRKERIWTA